MFSDNKNLRTYHKDQKGSSYVIFFVLFVLPLLSFLLTLSFDVASVYTKSRGVQDILDEAAIQGAKFFPYKEYALTITENYLQRNGLSSEDYMIKSDSNGININYQKDYPLVFSNLLNGLVGRRNLITFPVKASTHVIPSVNDILLLLDRNFYNSPNLEDIKLLPNPDNGLWGTNGDWPSLNYFEQNNEEFTIPRYYTQQCLNEVYLPLKRLLLDTYNFLGSMSLNSVGVGVYPGVMYSREAQSVKEIKKVTFSNNEAHFLEYNGDDGTTSIDCLKAIRAENEEEKYELPKIFSDYIFGDDKINKNQDLEVENNFSSLAASIWTMPVHKSGAVNFASVLDYSVRTLLATEKREDRRKTDFDVTKDLIIFTSHLPENEDEIKTELKLLDDVIQKAEIKINIVFALLKNNRVPTRTAFRTNLTSQTQNFKVFTYFDEDEEELTQKLHKFLWLNKREGSIWR